MSDQERNVSHGRDEPVPTVQTDSGERQLDPDADEAAEKAARTSDVLEESVHEPPPADEAEL